MARFIEAPWSQCGASAQRCQWVSEYYYETGRTADFESDHGPDRLKPHGNVLRVTFERAIDVHGRYMGCSGGWRPGTCRHSRP